MKRRITLVTAVLWIGMTAASAAEKPAHSFRFDGERSRRPVPRSPARIDVPEALRHPAAGTAVSPPVRPATPADGAAPGATARRDELTAAAQRAAARAAELRVRRAGVREYYRVGFWSGMRHALDAAALGDWDRAEGERDGRRDLEARRLGHEAADGEADGLAREAAQRQVIEQFSDLRNSIEFDPLPGAPGWRAPRFAFEPPSLEQVLEELGFDSRPWYSRRAHLRGWELGPVALRRCETYTDFYDGAWSDPALAFDAWRSRGDSEWFHGLGDPAERAWVARVFGEAFDRWVAHYHETVLLSAHREGLDDGWDYGAFVRAELEYRVGYVAGFARAARRAAEQRFHTVYAGLYVDWYRHWHDDWSRSVKPAIGEIRLHDGNDDGVFEPGERLFVEYEALNLGGAAGWVPLTIAGAVLVAPVTLDIELPARDRIRRDEGLAVLIDPAVEPRTRTTLRADLAGEVLDVPLRVAHPLEFDRRALHVVRDNLAGRVRAEVIVENHSRRPVEGRVELAVHRAGVTRSQPLGRLDGLSHAMAVFELDGLDPLALVAGELSLTFSARADGLEQDRYRSHLSDTVRDLGNRDLHLLLAAMARDESTTAREIRQARELLMLRLREDWKVAAMGSGNPYKRDLRQGGTATALGDLVLAVESSRAVAVRPEVFAGLSAEVEALADSLPGVHPFLRKSMCKLARRLP